MKENSIGSHLNSEPLIDEGENVKDFKEHQKFYPQHLSNFDEIPNSNVCLIKIHGSYFDSRTPGMLYFPVPDNVIICNLRVFNSLVR